MEQVTIRNRARQVTNLCAFCEEVFDACKELLFYERQKEIIAELEDLDL